MRSMVEGARVRAATEVRPLHHRLRRRSPSPFRGGAEVYRLPWSCIAPYLAMP
jgi:hypothetical protein